MKNYSEIDINDISTWDFIPEGNITQLNEIILAEIGYFYCYISFWRPEKEIVNKNDIIDIIKDYSLNKEKHINNNNLFYFKQIIVSLELEMKDFF